MALDGSIARYPKASSKGLRLLSEIAFSAKAESINDFETESVVNVFFNRA